ncbi:hypothetical protein FND52_05455 [Atlantibacter subterranea]|uniref:hypothetical protein n=1 Tax=Atlantibacter subterraneus TaxID=255519 RepID=UPI0011841443|nr:hypothetical protein [Atlantibacter subterranea]TSJ58791.1 hypothetical protein FND52_05455 [Atlantibacter subterranea]
MSNLPHLDYYRIDRAAKKIRCEVEDLIHWGANNKINLCIMLNMAYSYFYSTVDVHSLNRKFESLQNNYNGYKEISKYSLIYSGMSSDEYNFPFFNENGDEFSVADGDASGLWAIDCESLKRIELNGYYDKGLVVVPTGNSCLEGFFGCALPESAGVKITEADLWMTWEDVERVITNNFFSGTQHNALEIKASKSLKISNVVSERHAKRREMVLIAAIFCKGKYPHECEGSIRAWANCIERYATDILYANGGEPLSLDRIERILGKAIAGKALGN